MRFSLLIILLLLCASCTQNSDKENVSEQSISVAPSVINLPERHYLVLRQELPLDNMTGFFGIESEALVNKAQAAGIEATGPISGLFYRWDTDLGVGDAAVALPVTPGTELAGYVAISLPAQRAFAAYCEGDYTGLGAIHYALNAQFEIQKLQPAIPSVEEYELGPVNGVDESLFRTRIIYPIQE